VNQALAGLILSSAGAGLSGASVQEVEDELALKKRLHLNAGKYIGLLWT